MIFILPTNTCFWIWCFVPDFENYSNIYKIKNRDFSKPFSIFVYDFEYLQKYTDLQDTEIFFLQNYKKPFTILIKKENIKDEVLLQNLAKLPNFDLYEKVWFRIAHTFMQKRMIEDNWPFFLSSANKSWQSEIKTTKKVKEIFQNEIQKYWIKVFAHDFYEIPSQENHSQVLEFTKKWLLILRD